MRMCHNRKLQRAGHRKKKGLCVVDQASGRDASATTCEQWPPTIPLAPHSSFIDLEQSSYVANLRSHSKDLGWELGKQKELALLDSIVECRHLEQ